MTGQRAPLTPEQIAVIRDDLLRALARLEKSMSAPDETMLPVTLDQSTIGRLSRIDALQNQGLTENLQERERVKLALITAALRRIEEGTFGRCNACGEPIEYERLLVFPETQTCSGCAAGG